MSHDASLPVRARARAALSPPQAAFTLACLLGLQPLTTDLYLPALPTLTRALGAPMAAAQLTMSALILAFGFGQLALGPVADRFGRRAVLLAGLALYAASALGGAFATSIEQLVIARALQGVGLAAAVVCARAMVRDLYPPHEGMHVMSMALSGLGLVAVASPTLGGLIVASFGWRATLATVGAVGLALWIGLWLRVPETAPTLNPRALSPGPLAATWSTILRNPTFRAFALLTASTYCGLFVVLAGSSFIYIEVLGLSPRLYGLVLGTHSIAYIGGTVLCRRLLARHGVRGAVARGGVFTLAGGALIVALALAGVQSVWAVLLPCWLYAIGHGIHQPCSQTGAVSPFPQAAGAAAALAGFMLSIAAFGVGQWLGRALDGTVRPFALGLGFFALTTATLAWTLVQRHGLLPSAPSAR